MGFKFTTYWWFLRPQPWNISAALQSQLFITHYSSVSCQMTWHNCPFAKVRTHGSPCELFDIMGLRYHNCTTTGYLTSHWLWRHDELEWGCPFGTKYPPQQPIPTAQFYLTARVYRRRDRRTDGRTGWFQYTPPNFVAGGIKIITTGVMWDTW